MNNDGAKLVNLAFRVRDLTDAESTIENHEGWRRNAVHEISGEKFLEANLGDTRVNFFESAIYDHETDPKEPGFLHVSLAVSDLEKVLANPQWGEKLIWGPETISGGFGHRRIAFFELLPGCRIELMEELK